MIKNSTTNINLKFNNPKTDGDTVMDDKRPNLLIDSSVFMGAGTDPFNAYRNSNIIVAFSTIEDLENHRSDQGGIGWACRETLKAIEDWREQSKDQAAIFTTGLSIDGGNTLRIVDNSKSDRGDYRNNRSSSRAVISVAVEEKKAHSNLLLVSNSPTTCLLASKSGITSERYSDDTFRPFTGWFDVPQGSDADFIERLIANTSKESGYKIPANVAIREIDNNGNDVNYMLVRNGILDDVDYTVHAGGVRPREGNIEQTIALNYLMDPSIRIVSLGGVAGGGKTMLALGAGMDQVRNGNYSRIIVFRSMEAVGGQEVGILPGDLDEKMKPWTQAIWDNVDQIDRMNGRPTANDVVLRHMSDISVQPVTYLRGRTLVKTFIIVDDAQSLERSVLRDIIKRMGKGSKLVFTHDWSQNDNRYVSIGTSILSIVRDLVPLSIFAHINFEQSERSEVVQMVSEIIDKEF